MRTVGRYNIDNTFDIYPVFSQRRWHDYNILKDDKNQYLNKLKLIDSQKVKTTLEESYKLKGIENCNIQIDAIQKKMDGIYKPRKRKNTKTDGFQLNKKAQKKCGYMMRLLHQRLKKKSSNMGFYTFTCTEPNFKYEPKKHDREVTQQFQKLIENLRKHYGLKYYVYVAERQDGKRIKDNKEATNRIHYHCIFVFDNVLPHIQKVNYYWLELLSKIRYKTYNEKALFDYVELYKNTKYDKDNYSYRNMVRKMRLANITNDITKFLPCSGMGYQPTQVRNHKQLLGRNLMNNVLFQPVHVDRIKNHETVASYIAKYVVKSDEKIYSRVWGASKVLLQAVTQTVIDDVSKVQDSLVKYKKKWFCDKTKKEIERPNPYINEIPIPRGGRIYKDKKTGVVYNLSYDGVLTPASLGVDYINMTYKKWILNQQALQHGVFAQFRQKLMSEFDSLVNGVSSYEHNVC